MVLNTSTLRVRLNSNNHDLQAKLIPLILQLGIVTEVSNLRPTETDMGLRLVHPIGFLADIGCGGRICVCTAESEAME